MVSPRPAKPAARGGPAQEKAQAKAQDTPAGALLASLRQAGSPERAAKAKAYMRSDLDFTGTSVPAIRRIAAGWLKENPGLAVTQLREVVEELWNVKVFEARLLGAVLLEKRARLLTQGDLPWLEERIRDSAAWAILDTFVQHAVAHVLARDPALRRRTLMRWADDDDFWVRRSALLAMVRDLARQEGDWPLWTRLAEQNLEDQARWATAAPTTDERFFIRKAIGWVLRERGAKVPEDTVRFVAAHRARMAGLTLREATRNLSAAHQKHALAGTPKT